MTAIKYIFLMCTVISSMVTSLALAAYRFQEEYLTPEKEELFQQLCLLIERAVNRIDYTGKTHEQVILEACSVINELKTQIDFLLPSSSSAGLYISDPIRDRLIQDISLSISVGVAGGAKVINKKKTICLKDVTSGEVSPLSNAIDELIRYSNEHYEEIFERDRMKFTGAFLSFLGFFLFGFNWY